MSLNNDTPKIWTQDPTDNIDEVSSTEVAVIEEVPPLTIAEQQSEIDNSVLSEESKGMLGSLVEMNAIANTLLAIHSDETADQRKTVLTAWCESFVNARMRNNVTSEKLKARLLDRLIDNIENLDLETVANIYNQLTEVSSIDAQQAMVNVNGNNAALPNGQSGLSVTINNATADGAMITNNTMNNNGQSIQQLKEVATLNSSIKAWNSVPLIKKTTSGE